MAISKKGLRKIIVDKQAFVWRAIPDGDGNFLITVCSPERNGQELKAFINIISEKGVLIITNYIVRQIILFGFSNNWTPNKQKKAIGWKYINEEINLEKATYWNGKYKTTANTGFASGGKKCKLGALCFQ